MMCPCVESPSDVPLPHLVEFEASGLLQVHNSVLQNCLLHLRGGQMGYVGGDTTVLVGSTPDQYKIKEQEQQQQNNQVNAQSGRWICMWMEGIKTNSACRPMEVLCLRGDPEMDSLKCPHKMCPKCKTRFQFLKTPSA